MAKKYNRKMYPKKYPKSNYSLGGALSTASKALTVAYGVKKLLNVEKKYHDVATGIVGTPYTGTVQLLNGIAQGDTQVTRDGMSIKQVGLQLRYRMNINSLAGNTQFVRCIVFKDLQADGTAPTMSEVLSYTTHPIQSPLNIINGKRFKVLSDVVMNCNLPAGGNSLRHKNVFIKLNDHVRYSGTGSSASDIASGSIYLLFFSDDAADTPGLNVVSRLRYIDN